MAKLIGTDDDWTAVWNRDQGRQSHQLVTDKSNYLSSDQFRLTLSSCQSHLLHVGCVKHLYEVEGDNPAEWTQSRERSIRCHL